MYIYGTEAARKLASKLNIDIGRVRKIEIVMEVGNATIIRAEYLANNDEIESMERMIIVDEH